ncbi:MAG: alkaline phosphatase family protein [Chloroflexota bacterium]
MVGLLVALILAACGPATSGGRGGSAPAASGTSRSSASTSSTAPAIGRPPAAPPTIGHIFLIVMENKEYGEIVGSRQAPYINGLAHRYVLATRYDAVRHPSLPNYLALLGGDTLGVTSDCTRCFVSQPNLIDQLESHGKSWKAYMEDLPRPCSLSSTARGSGGGVYVLKHDPFLYFQDIRTNPVRCRRVVPLTQINADLSSPSMPDFAWISPNLQHDMHDGSVAGGDRWLAGFVPRILTSPAWKQNGLLAITWDEGRTNQACCGVPGGGHVATLLISPLSKPGYRFATPATHYSLLRTVEDIWGLGHLAHAADQASVPLLDAFARG